MEKREIKKGDYIVYGSNGICQIEDVKPMSFAQGTAMQDYYVVRQANHPGSTIFIPTDSDSLRGRIRPVLTPTEIEEILAETKGQELSWIEDRKERGTYFQETLMHGTQKDLLLMIRCIDCRRHDLLAGKKKLSGTDHDFLLAAEKMIREEFAFSLGIPQEAVGQHIRDALEIEDWEE